MDRGNVIIVGAGMGGLACGMELRGALAQSGSGRKAALPKDVRLVLIDKGRQVGGRMATRRFHGFRFDTGAQFMTAPGDSFASLIGRAVEAGEVKRWYRRAPDEKHTTHLDVWRGARGMTDLPKWMAGILRSKANTKFLLGTRVLRIRSSGNTEAPLLLEMSNDAGETTEIETATVVLTAPIDQSLAMLDREFGVRVPADLLDSGYDPCLVLLAVLPTEVASMILPAGYRRLSSDSVEWIADNGRKGLPADAKNMNGLAPGGRDPGEYSPLTVHFSPAISRGLFDKPPDTILATLIDELARLPERLAESEVQSGAWRREVEDLPADGNVQLKKWRYARPVRVTRERVLDFRLPGGGRILFAGDIFGGSRVEGAFLSGLAAARRILE